MLLTKSIKSKKLNSGTVLSSSVQTWYSLLQGFLVKHLITFKGLCIIYNNNAVAGSTQEELISLGNQPDFNTVRSFKHSVRSFKHSVRSFKHSVCYKQKLCLENFNLERSEHN